MNFQGLNFQAWVYHAVHGHERGVPRLALLARGYMQTRIKLLFLCALCFVGLALNNLAVVIDLVITGPEIDLRPLRAIIHLAALAVLIYGFIWEANA